MGFIFRTVFWLSLAMVVLPPQARIGGGAGDVAWQDIDVALELHNIAYAAWGLGVEAMSSTSCDANPQLCKTAVDLWDTTVATTTGLREELNDRLKETNTAPHKLAENEHRAPKKIQARVE